MRLQTSDPHAWLEASVDIEASRVSIAYVVENRSPVVLHLFNRLYRRCEADGYPVDPDRVEIEIRDGLALVSKKLVPVPDDMEFEFVHLPCMTQLLQGASFEERVSVPLPLVPRTPYQRSLGIVPRRRPMLFALGYSLGGPGPSKVARVVRTPDGTALRFDAFTASKQRLLTLGPFGDVPTMED